MSELLLFLLLLSSLSFAGATLLYLRYLQRRQAATGFWATLYAFLGWVALTLGGTVRGALLGRLPLGAFSDSLLLFAWALATVYLVVEYRWKLKAGGAFLLPAVSAATACGFIYPAGAAAILPILKDPWVGVHAALVFSAYGAFAVAALAGALYLVQERELKTKRLTFMHFSLPSLQALEELHFTLVQWGFPLLTAGLIVGGVVARRVWGAYLPLDPKMLLATLIWLYYGAYLWGKRRRGLRGRKAALLAVLGFFVLVFNFLGLPFVLGSLHRF